MKKPINKIIITLVLSITMLCGFTTDIFAATRTISSTAVSVSNTSVAASAFTVTGTFNIDGGIFRSVSNVSVNVDDTILVYRTFTVSSYSFGTVDTGIGARLTVTGTLDSYYTNGQHLIERNVTVIAYFY